MQNLQDKQNYEKELDRWNEIGKNAIGRLA
jgi:hypothetical protein